MNEPTKIEYRINSKNELVIYGSDEGIYTTSLLFVQKEFLNNISNYEEQNIFIFK